MRYKRVMRARTILAAWLIALAGCTEHNSSVASQDAGQDLSGGSSDGAPVDLTAGDGPAAPADLALVDVAAAPDVGAADQGGFCAGTAVAGTCVQAFFAPLSACFAPAGSCHLQTPAVVRMPVWCWSDGAQLNEMMGVDTLNRSYIGSGGAVCFTQSVVFPGLTSFSAGGATLSFNPATGAYRCPNGTTGTVGAGAGGCAALDALVNPPTGGCTAGVCPF
jgi:hypothetical protein